jgi:hypothetical protein
VHVLQKRREHPPGGHFQSTTERVVLLRSIAVLSLQEEAPGIRWYTHRGSQIFWERQTISMPGLSSFPGTKSFPPTMHQDNLARQRYAFLSCEPHTTIHYSKR